MKSDVIAAIRPHGRSSTTDVLRLESVTKVFAGKAAVDGITLSIQTGGFVGIIGRSGAGKSTLLRMINRLVEPTAGHIRYGDLDVTQLKGRALNDWRARAAMVFQQFNLVGRLDVLTNVILGRLNRARFIPSMLGLWSEDDKAIALAALEQFDVAGLAAQRADSLSGGQQQRVALARALAQEPDFVLADEPIASLDPRNTRIVMDALRRLNREFGITVICNLHSVDLAKAYCDRVVGMAAGRVVCDGLPSTLSADVIRDLYGMEATEVLEADEAAEEPSAPAVVAGGIA